MLNELLYDVLVVDIKTHKVSLMGKNKTQRNAEAIENMAVMRRGVDDQFFVTVEAGKYKDGDERREQAERDAGVTLCRMAIAPQEHPDFDGEHCVECGEDIPHERLAMGRVRCVECQELEEGRC